MYQPKSEIPTRVLILRNGTRVAIPDSDEEQTPPSEIYARRVRELRRFWLSFIIISLVGAWLLAAVLP